MSLPSPGRWVLATGNVDKARELNEVLVATLGRPLVARPLETGGDLVGFVLHDPTVPFEPPVLVAAPDVEETGPTLEDNARIKASAVCAATGLPTIADDTGLVVDALGGAPGVHSARYAGEAATYQANVDKLLAQLEGVPAARRTARFATVAIVRWPDGRELVAAGAVEGRITDAARGTGGFGYDSVFVPLEGDGRTFAEMSPDEKHALSHRGRAVRALAVALRDA